MKLSKTHYELQANIAKVKTHVDTMEEEVKHTTENVNKLISIFQNSFETFVEKISQTENTIVEVDKAAITYKKQLTELQKYQLSKVTIAENSPKTSFPIDNPLHRLRREITEIFSQEPILFQSGSVDSYRILKKYATACGIYLRTQRRLWKREDNSLWTFSISLKLFDQSYFNIIAEATHEDFNILKESMSKSLLLDLSTACKVIMIKKFVELNCRPINIVPTREVSLASIIKIEDQPLNLPENRCNWEVKVGLDLINPSSVCCKLEANPDTVEFCMIEENLNDIFKSFIQSDDLDDLICMPEVGSTTQNEIKSLINKTYKPWLDGIPVSYNEQSYLVIRKVFDMKKLTAILECHDGKKGPYKLLQPGELSPNEFEGNLVTPRKSTWAYPHLPQANNTTSESVKESTENNITPTVDSVVQSLPMFPDVIKAKSGEPLDSSFYDVHRFLRDMPMVIEDRPYNDFREVLLKFGNDHNIFFNYIILPSPKEAHAPTRWFAFVSLRYLNNCSRFTVGCGDSDISAAADASKKALLILSKICHIIIRKTCQLGSIKRAIVDISESSPKLDLGMKLYTKKKGPKAESGSSSKPPTFRTMTAAKLMYHDAFFKVAGIISNYLSSVAVDDLIFQSGISADSQEFINQVVLGVRFLGKVKVIKFKKNEEIFFSLMKIIEPKRLHRLLLNSPTRLIGPYKLYSPGTLDITFLWNRPQSYQSDGQVLTMMYDSTIPTSEQLRAGPPIKPKDRQKKKLKRHDLKENFAKVVKHFVTANRNLSSQELEPPSKRQKLTNYNSESYIITSQWEEE